jgi:hypothetical protein
VELLGGAILALAGTLGGAFLRYRGQRDDNQTRSDITKRTTTSTEVTAALDAWKEMVAANRAEREAISAELSQVRAELRQCRVESAAMRARLDRAGL